MQNRNSSKMELNLTGIDAVIFDMDGVITDTARTHAKAWKMLFDEYLKQRAEANGEHFQPFDMDADYHRYVDGKPRYDGVQSFLTSRNIELPFGSPDDSAQKETVCGLGNLKNQLFLDLLRKEGANPYKSSVDLVQKLRSRGVCTAVISSSKNCQAILESAGLNGLFDATVDGVDAANMELEGKPDPAIFLEACKRLGVSPNRAAVVEDAQAGVEAGSRGGFGLVIGVDRAGQAGELRKRGADAVVRDLSEIAIRRPVTQGEPASRLSSIRRLPSALQKKDDIFARLSGSSSVVCLDYDGTLTPIVSDPTKAFLPRDTHRVLKRLAEHRKVVIISGRDLADVREMVGIEGIVYAGSHGLDVGKLADSSHRRLMERFVVELASAESELGSVAERIPGVRLERKRYTLAIHYRNVDDSLLDKVEQSVDSALSRHGQLRKTEGKKVFELRPDIEWDKGRALSYLLENLHVDSTRVVPLYIGDDLTDEDAFRAIENQGVGIVVGDDERPTTAQYRLSNPAEVTEFLEELVALLEEEVSRGPWVLMYEGFDPETEGLRESLCTLGNGYFATRGAASESEADGVHYPGTYVAGCYNRLSSSVAGEVVENESLVNLPNWLPLSFRLEDGQWFDLQQVELLDYRQELDMRRGLLTRLVHFCDEKGRRTRVSQRRFVSMASPHLAAMEMTVVAENWSGKLHVRSALDGRVSNSGVARYRQLNGEHLMPVEERVAEDAVILLTVETNQSHIRVAEAARTRLLCDGKGLQLEPTVIEEPAYVCQEFILHMEARGAVTVEKCLALFTSRDNAVSECGEEACRWVMRAPGFDDLLQSHVLSWSHLWEGCQLLIVDGERTSQILNLHIYHLLQTVSPNTIELDAGVPPRGLHGEAYRGLVMWDELFVFPFLNLCMPESARGLLMYRYRRLPEARWAARQAGFSGAMYPWQSGSDGREVTQRIHLNPRSGRWIPDHSHLQRHVNVAVAYNVWLYYQVTYDTDFLHFYGAEMLLEIARFWASVVEYNRSIDRYEIRKVMGPDEYHDSYPDAGEPGVDNNAYTNVMVAWVLWRAMEAVDLLPEQRRRALLEGMSLTQEELAQWNDISRKMCVPFNSDGTISQFEGYDGLQEFDWEGYRDRYGNVQRLDRILEAEGDTPNRYKVSKQADVLMLFYLLSAEEVGAVFKRLGYPFGYDTIPNNVDYYLKRTSDGSTLSRVVHSWVLARSKRHLSWHLFKEALDSDVTDIQGGTTAEGIHLGAMAGTVDLMQRCYTGIETRDDILRFNPSLPDDLKEMRFQIVYHQHRIDVWIVADKLSLSTRRQLAEPIKIGVGDHLYHLKPGETLELDLASKR